MSIAPPSPGSAATTRFASAAGRFAWLALVVLVFLPTLARAQVDPCDAVVEQIAEKIRRNGVKSFDLFVIDRDDPTVLKVVGNCRGGKALIVYSRHGGARPSADPAETRTAPDSSQPVPTTPGRPAGEGAAAPAPPSDPWAAGEVRECHFVYPKGWVAAPDAPTAGGGEDNGTGDVKSTAEGRSTVDGRSTADGKGTARAIAARRVMPAAGDRLAAADLELDFALRHQQPDETAADVLSRRPWDEVAAGLLTSSAKASGRLPDEEAVRREFGERGPSRSDWTWARSVASKGVFDPIGLQARHGAAAEPAPERVDAFPFRANRLFEGSRTVEASQAHVWQAGGRWLTAVALNPEWLSFEMGGRIEERPIYEYRCSIADTFPRDRFMALCAGFIERSTLGPDFPQQRCERSASGLVLAGRR